MNIASVGIGAMEPLLPPETSANLSNLALELVAKANAFTGSLHPTVRRSVGSLVRSMNCYYSNLIEGHATTPWEIDRALASDYSSKPEKRNLQMEAVAHIAVQEMIDAGKGPKQCALSSGYGRWIHEEFCRRLPEELLWTENPDTGDRRRVVPGAYRDGRVIVGHHVPPGPEDLGRFLDRFDEGYAPNQLSKMQRILAIGSAHHRYVWIHPFYDGNGRVVRLMSHAAFKEAGVGSELWSVARGLARQREKYRSLLSAADQGRRNDLDGRGNLSQASLVEFCEFFLETCVDQIDFMSDLLDFRTLSERIRIYVEERIALNELPRGSFALLREAWLAGEFERGTVTSITGFKDRTAREILYALTKKGLLVSDTPRGPVRLGFPIDIIERWFPLLYPTIR